MKATDQSSTSSGGIKYDIGEFPVELFSEFEAHRLLSLNAIRFFEGRSIEPARVLLVS